MREQVRLWFYSQLFMSVALVGSAPFKAVLGYEKMLDEDGREMHGSWGNLIPADEAFDRMGADVMRWQYCQQPPDRNLLFGYGPAHEIERKLLTLWNSVSFLVTYASIEGFIPRYGELETGPPEEAVQSLDRWLLARTQGFLAEAERAYESFLTVGVTVRSTRSSTTSRTGTSGARAAGSGRRPTEVRFSTLWYAIVQALRAIAPVTPFLAEFLWRRLVSGLCDDAPESVFLARLASGEPRPRRSPAGSGCRGESAGRRARPRCAPGRRDQAPAATPSRAPRRGARSRAPGERGTSERRDRR